MSCYYRSILSSMMLATLLVSGTSAARVGGPSPGVVRLSVSAACFSVRPHARFMEVNLGYVQPGDAYQFALAPQPPRGFGGGTMGTYRAEGHGVVHFAYPVPYRQSDVGLWTITAYHAGHPVARTSFRVVRGSCTGNPTAGLTPPQMIAQYFADFNAHRYYAAWLLEAPCGIGFTVSNGPGAPVGSEGYPGRVPWRPVPPRYANHFVLAHAHIISIKRLYIPILDRNHMLAFAISGWYLFQYPPLSQAPSFNNEHKSGFHVVKLGVWRCHGRWGIEPSYWLIAGGGELNWV